MEISGLPSIPPEQKDLVSESVLPHQNLKTCPRGEIRKSDLKLFKHPVMHLFPSDWIRGIPFIVE
jgi:hypothetical protein